MSVAIREIRDVRIGIFGTCTVVGRDDDGNSVEIVFRCADLHNLAPQLLHCAAIEASPLPRPAVGKSIGAGHLPVMAWRMGRSPANAEPNLELDLLGNVTLRLQFTAASAQQCGKALADAGAAASPQKRMKLFG